MVLEVPSPSPSRMSCPPKLWHRKDECTLRKNEYYFSPTIISRCRMQALIFCTNHVNQTKFAWSVIVQARN